jgi:anthranilate 1,2-dioxygenase small subunit
MMAAGADDPMLRLELMMLQDRYVSALDNDRLEDWPKLFVEDCFYEIIPKENEDLGLPAPLIHCDNAAMLRDRVISLRNANIYEKPTYRHFVSGLEVEVLDETTVAMTSNYVVINTSVAGETSIYQAGRYLDRVVRTDNGWRFQSKRVVYDTSRVQTALAIPI